MPELPEVESLRLSLLPFIKDSKINKVKINNPKIVSGKGTIRKPDKLKVEIFERQLIGKEIKNITRRAKNLILDMEDESKILIHLKMTGQLVFKPFSKNIKGKNPKLISGGHPIELSENELPNKHTAIIFELDNGTLFYNDVRQFGYVLYFLNEFDFNQENHFANLGLEPLSEEFTLENFKQALKKVTGKLKKVFLDQKVVVGLGNIYADEVCFASGVRPMRSIKSLKKREIERLFWAIKEILPQAVAEGGSSVANYLLADGSRGNYAKMHKVYGRGGKKCLTCGNLLAKIQFAGRTTVYCKICQK